MAFELLQISELSSYSEELDWQGLPILLRIVVFLNSRGVQRNKTPECADFLKCSNTRHCRGIDSCVGDLCHKPSWIRIKEAQEGTYHVECVS